MLKARRRALGLNATAVFEAVKVSRNHLSAVENARALPAEEMLTKLSEIFDHSTEDADYVMSLLEIARQDGWWGDYEGHVGDKVAEFCGLEYGAKKVRIYDPMVITGLLQTEDYARAIIAAYPDFSRREVDRSVDLRMRRQERVHPPDALEISLVQGETALHQEIGGREVLRRQLAHLASVAEANEATLDFRIQPFSSTPGGFATTSTVVLLDFTTSHLGTMAWAESPVANEITEDDDVVEVMELNYELALQSSLNREASLDLVKRRLAELR